MSGYSKGVYKVRLENCRFFAYHGVMPQERTVGNDFSVSVEVNYLTYDPTSDDIEGTVSYADLYEIVKDEMETPRNLLEAVAGHIVERIRMKFPQITSGTVTVSKLSPPITGFNGNASVSLLF